MNQVRDALLAREFNGKGVLMARRVQRCGARKLVLGCGEVFALQQAGAREVSTFGLERIGLD